MCNHHKPPRHGSALEHGAAHTRDHRTWSRRNFLKNLGLSTGASLMLGNLPVKALGVSPLTMALMNGPSDRVLVLIRLKGGNDGLNTVIPLFDYDTYRNRRPTIGWTENRILNLDNQFGLPDVMEKTQQMWQEGKMKVVNTVGYPEQNLSHFRSADIWSSASDAQELDNSGWLGRWIMKENPGIPDTSPEIPPAIQIGDSGSLTFNNEDMLNLAVSVSRPDELREIAENGTLYDTQNLPDCFYGEQVGYLRTIANSTFQYAEIIADAFDASDNSIEYNGSNLARQLSLVARLIKGNLGTKLYMVTLDGFDTHARQGALHPNLLQTLSESVQEFYDDLATAEKDKDVLCMTTSEFGRRIEENGSDGTDHGAAAPVMLFGEGLNGNGFVGQTPDLEEVDEVGNLIFSTDFRQIYATVLEDWLCVDAATVDMVLGRSFARLPLSLTCSTTTSTTTPVAATFEYEIRYARQGEIQVHYRLRDSAQVHIQVFDMLGQAVETLVSGFQAFGPHQAVFRPKYGLPNGMYVVRIQVGKQMVGEKIQVMR